MSEEPLYQTQHGLAWTVVRTFHEALVAQAERKGAIGRDDIDRAFAIVEGHWPSTLPVFRNNCRCCLERRNSAYTPDGRRKDFLTRLVFSYILAAVPSRMDPKSGKHFPQVIVRGIQKNVTSIFLDREYAMLNGQAQTIFATIGTDSDAEVWQRIASDDTMGMLADQVFVRLLLRFRQFTPQRQAFMSRIVTSVDPEAYRFTDADFCELFERMFGRFRGASQSPELKTRLDVLYGDDTADQVDRIFYAFDRYLEDVRLNETRSKSMESRRRRA